MTTPEELELAALEVADLLEAEDKDALADIVRQLIVRYRAARIRANNFEKALEAMRP